MNMTKTSRRVNYDSIDISLFRLESGEQLKNVRLVYEKVGRVGAPVILNLHALTGSHVAAGTKNEPGWWSEMIGPDRNINTKEYQVLTFNVLGGCNGSTGPSDINSETGDIYGTTFPFLTIRDLVRIQYEALNQLGIHRLHAVIGGSMGGMQVLEFGCMYPGFAERLICLAATPYLSDYGMAFNAVSRRAITEDPNWNNGRYQQMEAPLQGLEIARMLAMITYRTPDLLNGSFQRTTKDPWGSSHQEEAFQIESYLNYQGEKLSSRFDANTYLYLLKAMDSHDLGRGRGGWEKAIEQLVSPLYTLGFTGDLVYPPESMKEMVWVARKTQPASRFVEVQTKYGHDGFLVEFEKWGAYIKGWLHDG